MSLDHILWENGDIVTQEAGSFPSHYVWESSTGGSESGSNVESGKIVKDTLITLGRVITALLLFSLIATKGL